MPLVLLIILIILDVVLLVISSIGLIRDFGKIGIEKGGDRKKLIDNFIIEK